MGRIRETAPKSKSSGHFEKLPGPRWIKRVAWALELGVVADPSADWIKNVANEKK
jgi:hypothetical protein